MLTSRPMALFAAYIPFRHFFGFHVVIDGVAAIAGWSSRPVGIAWTVIGRPPIGSGLDMVREPPLLRDVPLCRQREVVVATLHEVALLVAAAIDECDVVETKGADGIGTHKITKNSIGMFLRVANNIGHAGLHPAVELLRMA